MTNSESARKLIDELTELYQRNLSSYTNALNFMRFTSQSQALAASYRREVDNEVFLYFTPCESMSHESLDQNSDTLKTDETFSPTSSASVQ